MRLLVIALVGAAITTAAQSPSSTTFTRVIAPFPVADEAGKPFELPFLGGLDVPRPQFADIDADGDYDLFVQEFRNDIWFFENTGTAKSPKYEWRGRGRSTRSQGRRRSRRGRRSPAASPSALP